MLSCQASYKPMALAKDPFTHSRIRHRSVPEWNFLNPGRSRRKSWKCQQTKNLAEWTRWQDVGDKEQHGYTRMYTVATRICTVENTAVHRGSGAPRNKPWLLPDVSRMSRMSAEWTGCYMGPSWNALKLVFKVDAFHWPSFHFGLPYCKGVAATTQE